MKKNLTVAIVLTGVCFFLLTFLGGCVSSPVQKEECDYQIDLMKVEVFSQVDESFIREMIPDEGIVGKNGEYLVFLFRLADRLNTAMPSTDIVWRTKGDNNTQVQKTDTAGVVSFWEPVGALSNSLKKRKSKWGTLQKNMRVKAYVNLVGDQNCKTTIKIQLKK